MSQPRSVDLAQRFAGGTVQTEDDFAALVDSARVVHLLLGQEQLDGAPGVGPGAGLSAGLELHLKEQGGLTVGEAGLALGSAFVGIALHDAHYYAADDWTQVYIAPLFAGATDYVAYTYSSRGALLQTENCRLAGVAATSVQGNELRQLIIFRHVPHLENLSFEGTRKTELISQAYSLSILPAVQAIRI